MYKRKMAQHRAHRNDEFVALGNEFQNLSQVDDDFVKSKPKKKQRFVKLLVGGLVLVACATAVLIHRRNQNALAEEEQFLAAERNEFLRRTLPPSDTMRDEAVDPLDANTPFRQEPENIQSISDGPATKFHRVPEMPSNDAAETAEVSPVFKSLKETMDMEAHSADEEGENVYTPIHAVRIPKLRTASLEHMKQALSTKNTPHLIEDQLSLKTNILPVEKQDVQENADGDIYSRPRPPYREEPRVDEDPADGQYDDNAEEAAEDVQNDVDGEDANAVDTENIVVDDNDYMVEVVRVENDDMKPDVRLEDAEDADGDVVRADADLPVDTLGEAVDADDNAPIDDTAQGDDENLEATVDVDEGELGNEAEPENEELDGGDVVVVDEGDGRLADGDERLDKESEVKGFESDNGEIGLKADVEEGADVDDDKSLEVDEGNVVIEGEDEVIVESDGDVDSDRLVDKVEQENDSPFRNQDDKGAYPDLAGVKVETVDDEKNSGFGQGGDPAAWYNQQEPNAADDVQKEQVNDVSSEIAASGDVGQQQQYDQNAQQPQYAAQEPQRQVFVYTDPNTGEQRYIVY